MQNARGNAANRYHPTMRTPRRAAVLPGAEPFWLPASREIGVLLIHGFTGSPAEVRGLGDRLQQAGISALGVRLPGHGTSVEDLLHYGRRSWVREAQQGFQALSTECQSVVICGMSMGGTIALNLAASGPQPHLRGVVAMAAPVRLLDYRYRPSELLALLNRWREWGAPDIKDRSRWATHVGYHLAPPSTTVQLIRLVHETYDRLPEVKVPILVLQSHNDHTVMPVNVHWLLDRVGSAERQVVWLENSHHVITVDYDAEHVADEVIAFVRRVGVCRV